MECCYWWYVASFTLGYIHAEEDSPMVEEGFFLKLGPWPSVDIDMGLLVFYPPREKIMLFTVMLTLYFATHI